MGGNPNFQSCSSSVNLIFGGLLRFSLSRKSHFSRVHGRFVCPVLVVDGKYLCRSATIAIEAETLMNNMQTTTSQFFSSLYVKLPVAVLVLNISSSWGSNESNSSPESPAPCAPLTSTLPPSPSVIDSPYSEFERIIAEDTSASQSYSWSAQREADSQLLKLLGVEHIVDLMVENRKK